MPTWQHMKWGAVLVWCVCTSAQAQPRWVHGSWVNLRAAPSASAAVVAQLTANSPVTLLAAPAGEWCQVQAETGAQGHVACALLGSKALTLADVKDKPERAFWVAPSLSRFIDYGHAMTATKVPPLSQERPEGSPSEIKLTRFKVPEFEAAKARVLKGIKPAETLARTRGEPTAFYKENPAVRLAPAPVRSSFFTDPDAAIVLGERGPEQELDLVATLVNTQLSVATVGKPKAHFSTHDVIVTKGLWDVGTLTVKLAAPVPLYRIDRSGFVSAHQFEGGSLEIGSDESCGGAGPVTLAARDELAKKTHPQLEDDNAILVGVYSLKPLPPKVKVKSRSQTTGTRDGEPLRQTLHEIDLNGDGVADLLVLEGVEPSELIGTVRRTQTFINIGGQWYEAGSFKEDECT